jgi:hypothetical protein
VVWCIAVDYENGRTLTYSGSAWTVGAAPSTAGHSIDDVSCTAATLCVAVGDDGTAKAWTFSTGGWSAAIDVTTPVGTNELRSVSCESVSFCAVVPGFVQHA